MRLLAVLCLAIAWSFAANSKFDSCIEKNRLAFEKEGEFIAIAVDKNRLLVPFGLLDLKLLPTKWKILKSDPLTGLAVVEADHQKTPVSFRTSRRFFEHDRFVAVLPNTVFESSVAKPQEDLCAAELEKPIRSSAIICAPCYAVMGVGVLGRFVESDYILHFLESKEPFGWGDLGFRLAEKSNKIEFVMQGSELKVGDEIVQIGDFNSTSYLDLTKKILFLTPSTSVKVGYKRDGKTQFLDLMVQKRAGGGVLADTFLESLGWQFTQDLFVHTVEKSSFVGSKNVKVGDKLIEINGTPVKNSKEVKTALLNAQDQTKLLIERDEFQFFIVINRE